MIATLSFAVPKLLDLLDAGTQDILLRRMRRRDYQAGQMIHQRGDCDVSMGIVLAGAVALLRRDASGRIVSNSTVTAGQHYGDLSMINARKRRTHDAVALSDCCVATLDGEAFDVLVATHPLIVSALYRVAAGRLAVTLDLLDDARSLGPAERISRVLTHALDANEGARAVACRQEDLAQLLGLSVVTISKALADLQRRGQVKLGYGVIEIGDQFEPDF